MSERIDDSSKFVYRAAGVPFDWNHHDYCMELVLGEGESVKSGAPLGYLGDGKCEKYDGTSPFCGILKHDQWKNKFSTGSRVNVQQDQRIYIKTSQEFEITGTSFPKLYVDNTGAYTSTEGSNKLVGIITENSISSSEAGKFFSVVKITGVQ